MALIIHFKLEIHQMDVKTLINYAFFEEVYASQLARYTERKKKSQ